ncbi:uncharacterized protein MONBRDRAFT_13645 [Monosiga brevicollis MX1]|uniref:Peptidase S74 domain-containing protein n=1 Tax=Monosiga brevicollis TaxID=81824 RepID=A9UP12_MONBE|nr:uncharacterized protein MONBRDRAFT_13645 [Monosiga brevicollis MX1]EDQ92338.1 predicted protein [Monosiga brevicollis MX1]|eukprot:XP_001742100.1 hypothetical protein [Monosiga brevicollis MX1]
MYGIKVEAPTQQIALEQSQTDRRKMPFNPIEINIQPNEVVKATIGRLHFAETTANNMRKKGRTNPDQRYFNLIVTVAAEAGGQLYAIASHRSQNIIVRASNPGLFESDTPVRWSRGQVNQSVYYDGHVGVMMDNPDEALCVRGNIRLSGAILQPSDARIKRDIQHMDTAKALQNIERIPLHSYRLNGQWAATCGEDANRTQYGVVAQELKAVLPDAVRAGPSVTLNDGQEVTNLLVVDKERLFTEALAAVQQLTTLNRQLHKRVESLEQRLR